MSKDKHRNFVFFAQHDAMDCGPTCLRMVAKHYGKNYSLEKLRYRAHISRLGISVLGLSRAGSSQEIERRTHRLNRLSQIKYFINPCPSVASVSSVFPFKNSVYLCASSVKSLKHGVLAP